MMNLYKTQMLNEKSIEIAARLIKDGEVVAIPTETVYGLAANALDKNAVGKIFVAKGRPQDNPLIIHVTDIAMAEPLVTKIDEKARKLFETFSPGPLTIILKKTSLIPNEVSAGLDTVAIRIPSHKIARRIISECNLPLAAPSANLSGKPSPTTAIDVFADMQGKIPAIVDGGSCKIGVESTVVSLAEDTPVLLRPGVVTLAQLQESIGEIEVSKGVLNQIEDSEKVSSPGMKYKHYSPVANVIILDGNFKQYQQFIKSNFKPGDGALCFEEEKSQMDFLTTISFGNVGNQSTHAKRLFSALREADEKGIKTLYARCPLKEDVDFAVYNRLLRAAGFNVIKL